MSIDAEAPLLSAFGNAFIATDSHTARQATAAEPFAKVFTQSQYTGDSDSCHVSTTINYSQQGFLPTNALGGTVSQFAPGALTAGAIWTGADSAATFTMGTFVCSSVRVTPFSTTTRAIYTVSGHPVADKLMVSTQTTPPTGNQQAFLRDEDSPAPPNQTVIGFTNGEAIIFT